MNSPSLVYESKIQNSLVRAWVLKSRIVSKFQGNGFGKTDNDDGPTCGDHCGQYHVWIIRLEERAD